MAYDGIANAIALASVREQLLSRFVHHEVTSVTGGIVQHQNLGWTAWCRRACTCRSKEVLPLTGIVRTALRSWQTL